MYLWATPMGFCAFEVYPHDVRKCVIVEACGGKCADGFRGVTDGALAPGAEILRAQNFKEII